MRLDNLRLGFWHEADAPLKDPAFADALAKGLIRFAKFVDAQKVNVASIVPTSLRKYVAAAIEKEFYRLPHK